MGAYALSEAGSGSDAFATTTRAVESDGEFRLTGRKLWIHQRQRSGSVRRLCDPESRSRLSRHHAFLVERGFDGFSVGKKGQARDSREQHVRVLLEECRVPRANVLGEAGRGYKLAIETLNEGRIGIGAQRLGSAQGALDHASRTRKSGNNLAKRSADFQGVQFQLATRRPSWKRNV